MDLLRANLHARKTEDHYVGCSESSCNCVISRNFHPLYWKVCVRELPLILYC